MRLKSIYLRQLFWAVALSAYFFLIYTTTNVMASHRPAVPSVYFEFERYMPFVPAMVVPYMSIDLFFFFAPFLCEEKKQMRVHATRIIFAITVAGIIFTIVPLKYGFERPHVEGIFAPICKFLWAADLPYNLAPSLHLALRTILWPVYVRKTHGWLRALVKIWFIGIGVSTLLVHQHHLIDVASGVALGFLALYLFDERISERATRRIYPILALRYLAAVAVCIAFAILFAPYGVIALWPALAIGLVVVAYLGVGPRVFRKLDNGHMLTAAKWVLEPYFLGQKAYAWWFTRKLPAYVPLTDRVMIGRRLSVREAREFAKQYQPLTVIDLAAEFQGRPALRAAAKYVRIPMLDLVPPTEDQLRQAVQTAITAEATGYVYIHCTMGMYRTIIVAAAYLLETDRAATIEEALTHLRALRPHHLRAEDVPMLDNDAIKPALPVD